MLENHDIVFSTTMCSLSPIITTLHCHCLSSVHHHCPIPSIKPDRKDTGSVTWKRSWLQRLPPRLPGATLCNVPHSTTLKLSFSWALTFYSHQYHDDIQGGQSWRTRRPWNQTSLLFFRGHHHSWFFHTQWSQLSWNISNALVALFLCLRDGKFMKLLAYFLVIISGDARSKNNFYHEQLETDK